MFMVGCWYTAGIPPVTSGMPLVIKKSALVVTGWAGVVANPNPNPDSRIILSLFLLFSTLPLSPSPSQPQPWP